MRKAIASFEGGVGTGGRRAASTTSKSVEFGVVEVLSFSAAIGDNPSVSNGPPIQLSWKDADRIKFDTLEDFERSDDSSLLSVDLAASTTDADGAAATSTASSSPASQPKSKRLPTKARVLRLRSRGYEASEIEQA